MKDSLKQFFTIGHNSNKTKQSAPIQLISQDFIHISDSESDLPEKFLSESEFDSILSSKDWKILIQQNVQLIKTTLIKCKLSKPAFHKKKTTTLEEIIYQ